MNGPITPPRLQQIASKVCQGTLQSVSSYDHDRTESWNTAIINDILQSLISESSQSPSTPAYKYIVNSTIIQHLPPNANLSYSNTGTSARQPTAALSHMTGVNEADARDDTHPVAGGASDERSGMSSATTAISNGSENTANASGSQGRRGMHSAVGAYWNNQTDGYWNWKFEGGAHRGMDVVVTVIWVST
ncbi:MAG: hypothetical protein M1817_006050 [Caeruleum heppii]|nr:MAG: hypothetical protein M1817_006050 [Caeruleum heppii]